MASNLCVHRPAVERGVQQPRQVWCVLSCVPSFWSRGSPHCVRVVCRVAGTLQHAMIDMIEVSGSLSPSFSSTLHTPSTLACLLVLTVLLRSLALCVAGAGRNRRAASSRSSSCTSNSTRSVRTSSCFFPRVCPHQQLCVLGTRRARSSLSAASGCASGPRPRTTRQ